MSPGRRGRLWCWVFLASLVACNIHLEKKAVELERLVDAPVTVDDIRARERPPDVVVEVERQTVHWDGRGGGCHHAAVCVLALLLDPGPGDEEYEMVRLVDHGKVAYEAVFADGSLGSAWLRDGERARFIKEIRPLGRRILVEAGTAAIGSDGRPGPITPSSVLHQVDLSAPYLARLIEDQKHGEHHEGSVGQAWARKEMKARATIGEMGNTLSRDDAARLARAWQGEPRLNAVVKQHLREQLLGQYD